MNIDNIEAFVFVNHFGSINKASKALFLSQPSVTSRIKSLERELDAELFRRVGRQLTITDKGIEFLPFAENIIRTMKKGKAHLQNMEEKNEITIACSGLVSFYLVPRLMAMFKEHFPEQKFRIMTETSETVARMVSDGEADYGFASNASQTKLNAERVIESPIRLIVPSDHPFADGGAIDIERLVETPIVFFECGSLDWTMVHNLFLSLKEQPDIQYEVDSMESAKGIILNRAAIGFLPELSVYRELEEGSLAAIDVPALSHVSLKTDLIHHNDIHIDDFDEMVAIIRKAASQRPGVSPSLTYRNPL
ncbi:LysR family transcriptional regulator [Salinicoccus roseus]|uniref:LysR family transcriptional regulator n=1 Tax=Salinicoccus roseus TaxID=45670 RepID=UPI0035680A9C